MPLDRFSDTNHPLAHVVAAIESRHRIGSLFKTFKNLLNHADVILFQPPREHLIGLIPTVLVVRSNEALHARARDKQLTLKPRPLRWRIPISKCHRAANHNARARARRRVNAMLRRTYNLLLVRARPTHAPRLVAS